MMISFDWVGFRGAKGRTLHVKQDLDTSLLFPSVIGRAHLALDKDGSP